ncbi:hypothetical protein C8R46DRAFT_1042115 [Mycena filopes]|nr:hypothetical protein C8R46DRAFT_1042115 [Mycena filopes]
MPMLDADQWELQLAQEKIKSLKVELAISKCAMKDYERVMALGISRLRIKHLTIKSDLRCALEQNEELTLYKEAQSIRSTERRTQKEMVEAAVMCGECLLTWFRESPFAAEKLASMKAIEKSLSCPACRASVRAAPNRNGALENALEALVQTGLIEYDSENPTPVTTHPYNRFFPILNPVFRNGS